MQHDLPISPSASPYEPVADSPRLAELVRRRWQRIDWDAPIPPSSFVISEAHYMDVPSLGLHAPQRVALNRLFACFTCELFIHFEGYVIRYLERFADRVPALSRPVIDRFVAEERVHSEAFGRLLHKLRPDLYPQLPSPDQGLRFLGWSSSDDLALRIAPLGTFFLLAWLFEEITLFVPQALDQSPEQCAQLVSEVMRLHAREEQPHVALDERVLVHLTGHRPRWQTAVHTLLTLPLLVYVNGKVKQAWRRLVTLAASEIELSPEQLARIRDRGPTQSDRWGMQSFADKMACSGIAGAPMLCWALRRELRAAASGADAGPSVS